jgi:hypothetical protein
MYRHAPFQGDRFWPGPRSWPVEGHRHYVVRVRDTKYLWGSAGITSNVSFASPMILHIHNDVEGEPVTFGTATADGTKTTIGTLQAGESFSISIQNNICGVFATCTPLESEVSCLIKA